MSHGMRQRLKKLEKNINPIKTLDDILKTLNNSQLKTFITIKSTRDMEKLSEAFGWELEKAQFFIEDLINAPPLKEYSRQSNQELIDIIMDFRRIN
jgi:hypothetical protein